MRLLKNMLNIFRKPKPKREFPKWCKARCHGALNDARRLIEGKGTKLNPHDIRVKVIEGCQRFSGGWGWHVPAIEINVGGLTWPDGKLIEIAIDPTQLGNPNALHYDSLVHEMAHHWLICNGHGGGHDSLYDGVIPGWKEARKVTGKGRV